MRVNFDALAQRAIFESKGDKLSSSFECRIRNWEVSDTNSPTDSMPTECPFNAHSQTEEQTKNLNSTARPYDE